jgi:hypothetical protein
VARSFEVFSIVQKYNKHLSEVDDRPSTVRSYSGTVLQRAHSGISLILPTLGAPTFAGDDEDADSSDAAGLKRDRTFSEFTVDSETAEGESENRSYGRADVGSARIASPPRGTVVKHQQRHFETVVNIWDWSSVVRAHTELAEKYSFGLNAEDAAKVESVTNSSLSAGTQDVVATPSWQRFIQRPYKSSEPRIGREVLGSKLFKTVTEDKGDRNSALSRKSKLGSHTRSCNACGMCRLCRMRGVTRKSGNIQNVRSPRKSDRTQKRNVDKIALLDSVPVRPAVSVTCAFNAKVAAKEGHEDIAELWRLLEHSTATHFQKSAWVQHPLGRKLVDRIMRRLEKQGDVQMLATITCALSNHSAIPPVGPATKAIPTAGVGNSYMRKLPNQGLQVSEPSWLDDVPILDPSKGAVYDGYRNGYAKLLLEWNLMQPRAEVLKYVTEPKQPDKPEKQEQATSAAAEVADAASLTQPDLLITCSRCEDPVDNLWCLNCKQFALSCALCDLVVRGQGFFCQKCGHGGHVGHMQTWFSRNTECPAGCGCKCSKVLKSSVQRY